MVIAPNTPNYINPIKSAQFILHVNIVLLENFPIGFLVGRQFDWYLHNRFKQLKFTQFTQNDVFVYLHVHDNAIDELI